MKSIREMRLIQSTLDEAQKKVKVSSLSLTLECLVKQLITVDDFSSFTCTNNAM